MFKVVQTDIGRGEITLEWTATNTPNVKLLLNHRVPPECIEFKWTEAQYRSYLELEVEDAPAIPDWAIAEEDAHQYKMYLASKGRS